MIGTSEVTPEVAHRGVLARGCVVAEYYTSQPAPTQWLAIGLVSTYSDDHRDVRSKQLLVGTGRTETVAVKSLWDRLGALPSTQMEVRPPVSQVPGTDGETVHRICPAAKSLFTRMPVEPAIPVG
jgi:hypothetical protein